MSELTTKARGFASAIREDGEVVGEWVETIAGYLETLSDEVDRAGPPPPPHIASVSEVVEDGGGPRQQRTFSAASVALVAIILIEFGCLAIIGRLAMLDMTEIEQQATMGTLKDLTLMVAGSLITIATGVAIRRSEP